MWPWVLAAGVAGYTAYQTAWPAASQWGRSFHRLPGEGRRLALTFDDGPSNETPRFLEALDQLGVPATFFVCGENVERRPEVARAIVEAGHEIGNHTTSHTPLPLCGPKRVRAELAATQQIIEDTAGVNPRLFRAPYGLRSPWLGRVQRELGLVGVYWTLMGRDWALDGPDIAARVLNGASAGGIVCLHDGEDIQELTDRASTLRAVRAVVPILRDQGYEFVGLSDGGA